MEYVIGTSKYLKFILNIHDFRIEILLLQREREVFHIYGWQTPSSLNPTIT